MELQRPQVSSKKNYTGLVNDHQRKFLMDLAKADDLLAKHIGPTHLIRTTLAQVVLEYKLKYNITEGE